MPKTALGEVSYYSTRKLQMVGRFENIADYAELIADFSGPFHDLRNVDVVADPVLHKNSAIASPAGQRLACRLRVDQWSNGLSIHQHGGRAAPVLVCFRPHLIQNLRPGGIWRLEWKGSPTATVMGLVSKAILANLYRAHQWRVRPGDGNSLLSMLQPQLQRHSPRRER